MVEVHQTTYIMHAKKVSKNVMYTIYSLELKLQRHWCGSSNFMYTVYSQVNVLNMQC